VRLAEARLQRNPLWKKGPKKTEDLVFSARGQRTRVSRIPTNVTGLQRRGGARSVGYGKFWMDSADGVLVPGPGSSQWAVHVFRQSGCSNSKPSQILSGEKLIEAVFLD
jgi:hypothetical protein